MGTNSKSSHQSYAVAPGSSAGGGADISAPAVAAGGVGLSLDQDGSTQLVNAELLTGDSVALPSAAEGSEDPGTDPEPSAAELPSREGSEESPIVSEELGPAETESPDLRSDVATPIPDTPTPGLPYGEAILVGGEDLHSSTAALVSYLSGDDVRTVLHAVVSEESEAKLLDALHLSGKMIPVQVEEMVTGRFPLDEQHQIFDKILTAAKSVNYHHGHGDLASLPATTAKKLADAQAAITAAQDGGMLSSADQTMLQQYQAQLEAVTASANSASPAEHVLPHLHEGLATVTKYVPEPAEDPSGGKLAASTRPATRIKPTLDGEGQAHWDGTARTTGAQGVEYVVDLGEGFSAVYRPYEANDPKTTEYSLRGRLEIIAPAGEGHGADVVKRLGALNLANQPMTHAEGEWSYLNANVHAQGLSKYAEVAQAVAVGRNMEQMMLQELFHERSHQAIGLDAAELNRFAKGLQLEAHTRSLPAKVGVLRNAVAAAAGYSDGDQLRASADYNPVPNRSAGWLTWERFDVTNNTTKMKTAYNGKCLTHHVSGGNLKALLGTGVLASTERRALMGIGSGLGMSEATDKQTGGASSVFTRLKKPPKPEATQNWGGTIIWDDPTTLLSRSDYYGADGDTFGAVNPAKTKGSTKSTRDPMKIAGFTSASNEVMFRDGIDLFGKEGPSRIICHSAKERTEISALLAEKGITTIGGRPVEEVLVS